MQKAYLSGSRWNGTNFFVRKINSELSEDPTVREHTTVFQEDVSRIIHSSGFRRMQNKTQVHPLPESDYFRNRLTHSLEVSEIGQLIANAVGKHLDSINRLPMGVTTADFKDIIASACLIHDIGNPPFGHNGEEAIQCWFEGNQDLDIVAKAFEDKDVASDFLRFDGNAQGFRVANRLLDWRDTGGLRLSLAAIGASVKYPWSSADSDQRIGKKKFGFMKQDQHIFEKIFTELGLCKKDGNFFRHPLAFIVEAADDIAYLTTDIEDGVKSGSIQYDVGYALLDNCSSEFHKTRIGNIDIRNEGDVINYLRSAAISTMVDCAFVTFVDENNYEKLQSGDFSGSLLGNSMYSEQIEEIKTECNSNLYTRRDKLETEAGGHHMIEKLLDIYLRTADEFFKCGKSVKDMRKKYRNIFYLLPNEIIKGEFSGENETSLCYKMVDHVSGMTDTHVVRTYRSLFGGRNYFK